MRIEVVFVLGVFVLGSGLFAKEVPSAKLQFPNLVSLADRTDELARTIENREPIPGGVYRITATIELELEDSVFVKPSSGPVTLIMDGAGPAIRVVGTHEGTADPKTFKASTWKQRMPIIEGIEILGNHSEADGIELTGCVQPIVSKVAIRWCRHGIRLVNRNRNVAISDCQLYENAGIGLYLDDVNLHQINVSNSHISYNRQGGIVVRDGNVRNLQITGCDLEANMPGDVTPTHTANILLDVSGSKDDKTKSIAEVAITGCTIQHSANYGGKSGKTVAEGGANIRLKGKELWPIDSVTITGNVISDTTTSVEIDHSMDVTLSGNTFFAPKPNNLVVTSSQRILVSGNTFNPRQFERPGTIRFVNSEDCVLANCILKDFKTSKGAIIVEGCKGFQVRGNILTGCESGIVIRESSESLIHDNLFREFKGDEKVEVGEGCSGVTIR